MSRNGLLKRLAATRSAVLERVLGNQSRLPFDLLLSIRSHILCRPLSAVLAVLALACSVALAASVEMATRSVNQALEASVQALVGTADLEISAGSLGVSEVLVDRLRSMPQVQSASPVIQQTMRLVRKDRLDRAIRVLAIDLLYDEEVRSYGVLAGGFSVRDPARLLASPKSIVLTRSLADSLGLIEGDSLDLDLAGRRISVVVRGLLDGDLASAFGGQLAVMDVYALQYLLGRDGIVDRIDIALSSEYDVDLVLPTLQRMVGDGVAVRGSAARDAYVTPVLGAFGFGTWAIALVGVLLASFLTYAVISILVDRRIVEFALLRAAGMDPARVRVAVLIDSLGLAVAGSLIGLLASTELADLIVQRFSRASEYLQDIRLSEASHSWASLSLGISAGLPVALLASIEPALRASRRHPLDVVRDEQESGTVRDRLWILAVFGLLGVVGTIASVGPWLPWAPEVRLALAIVCGTCAVGSASCVLLSRFLAVFVSLGSALVPRVGALVGITLSNRLVETGATIGIWAALTGGLFSLFVGLQSIGTSLDNYFVGMVGSDAIIAFGEDPSASSRARRTPIDFSVAGRIRSVPGVVDLIAPRETHVLISGSEVLVDEIATEALRRHGGLLTLSADPESTIESLRAGEILVSSAFLARFGRSVGDILRLPTKQGFVDVRIGGIARAFTGPNGSIHVDSKYFDRWFDVSGARSLIFWAEGDVEEVVDAAQMAAGAQPLFFRYGESYQKQTRNVLARFNSMLVIPVFVIGAIGVIGLGNLLASNVTSRRRDFALVRASGGTPENVLAVVILCGLAVGIAGVASGLLLGAAWRRIIFEGLSERLGWAVSGSADPWIVIGLVVGGLSASLLGALIPALAQRRIKASELSIGF